MEIVKNIKNGNYHITLAGKFTFADNQEFRELLNEIISPDIQQITFNMTEVDFVDSAALGMLLLAQDEAVKHNKKQIVIENAQGQVKKMFSIARFDQYFLLK